MSYLGRREFIGLVGAAAWPLVARAQPSRIGFLGPTSPTSMAARIESLRAGFRDLG
jgi:hypothetical protein